MNVEISNLSFLANSNCKYKFFNNTKGKLDVKNKRQFQLKFYLKYISAVREYKI